MSGQWKRRLAELNISGDYRGENNKENHFRKNRRNGQRLSFKTKTEKETII